MTVRPLAFSALVALAVASASGERYPGFSVAAFNAAVPQSDRSVAFSPFGFELDSAVLSEAFDPINKARFVETLGALTGYDTVLLPLVSRYHDARTNGFEYVSARAFLTPDYRRLKVRYREMISGVYSVATCLVAPNCRGAEAWLEARSEGMLGPCSLSKEVFSGQRVSFREYAYIHPLWAEAFGPADVVRRGFVGADGVTRQLEYLTGVRMVESCSTRRYVIARLALADGAWFYVMLPNEGIRLDDIRDEFSDTRVDSLMAVVTSLVESGVERGPAWVEIPKLDVRSSLDLTAVFGRFRFPIGGMADIDSGEALESPRQVVRFVLNEEGAGAGAADAKEHARKLVLDRPFLYFVWHEPTRSMPVSGVFAGGVE